MRIREPIWVVTRRWSFIFVFVFFLEAVRQPKILCASPEIRRIMRKLSCLSTLHKRTLVLYDIPLNFTLSWTFRIQPLLHIPTRCTNNYWLIISAPKICNISVWWVTQVQSNMSYRFLPFLTISVLCHLQIVVSYHSTWKTRPSWPLILVPSLEG